MKPAMFRDPTAPVQPDQFEAEFTALLDIYRKEKPRRVLEIGVREGGSLYQWMKHAPGATVCAVDLPGVQWGYAVQPDVSAWREWAARFGCDLRVHLGNSHHKEAIDFIRENGPFDFVFIDGDHSAAGVLMDIQAALCDHYCSVIAIHDICPDSSDKDIEGWRVWPFLRALYGGRELTSTADQDSRGIGVLHV